MTTIKRLVGWFVRAAEERHEWERQMAQAEREEIEAAMAHHPSRYRSDVAPPE